LILVITRAQVGLRDPVGQPTNLRLDRPERPIGDECVEVPLVRSPFTFPPDMEAEEVEPITHMHDPRLGLGQPKAQRFEHLDDGSAEGFDVASVPVH
jgi:hypothetical protein